MFNKLLKFLSGLGNAGAIGLSEDQVSAYKKDMYKAERESQLEVPTVYNKVYKVVTNTKGAGDKYTQLLKAGPLTRHETEGQDIEFNSPIEGWTSLVKYHTYSDGLAFSPEAIEDTVKLGDMLKQLAGTWGEEVRVAKEELAAGAFNNGGDLLGSAAEFNGSYTGETDSSGDLLYDSVPLFNLTGNARTSKGGVATYYNSVTGLTVSPDNFQTLYNLATATNNVDEQDRVKANPVDTALVEPGADHQAMVRVLRTEKGLPGGELNDVNPYFGLINNIIPWDYLTDSAFYVGKAQSKDFEFHERLAPVIRFFRNENNAGYNASIRVRFGLHFKPGSWKAWTKGGGT
jgi:hypothetical protein